MGLIIAAAVAESVSFYTMHIINREQHNVHCRLTEIDYLAYSGPGRFFFTSRRLSLMIAESDRAQSREIITARSIGHSFAIKSEHPIFFLGNRSDETKRLTKRAFHFYSSFSRNELISAHACNSYICEKAQLEHTYNKKGRRPQRQKIIFPLTR
jgi:hypothetical protein